MNRTQQADNITNKENSTPLCAVAGCLLAKKEKKKTSAASDFHLKSFLKNNKKKNPWKFPP